MESIYPTNIDDIKPDAENWRIVFAIPLIFCFIRSTVFTLIFSDDPPAYYVSQKDENKVIYFNFIADVKKYYMKGPGSFIGYL